MQFLENYIKNSFVLVDLLRKFPFSVQIRKNTDQKKLRIRILLTYFTCDLRVARFSCLRTMRPKITKT